MLSTSTTKKVDLKTSFQENCLGETSNFYSDEFPECNTFLLKKELVERDELANDENQEATLYPNLNDADFNLKIASKREFQETPYDAPLRSDIEEYADELLNEPLQGLQPHQAFVKNFLSEETPYNSLLLFHGLGTGKTCSAIGVAEEMRDYMRKSNVQKKILFVAPLIVQTNFLQQLFDPRKLTEDKNGYWTATGCLGDKWIQEVNPERLPGIPKETLVKNIEALIRKYYSVCTFEQLANEIDSLLQGDSLHPQRDPRMQEVADALARKQTRQQQPSIQAGLTDAQRNRLKEKYSDTLLIIDEVHHLNPGADGSKNQKIQQMLEILAQNVGHMRMLFLSATPMYNHPAEIVWLLNLMNMNDRRGKMYEEDIFDAKGNFLPAATEETESGKELLARKATGYVSFVRGENPYTFPYRVYPKEFAKKDTFSDEGYKYPRCAFNGKLVPKEERKRILSLYLCSISCPEICGNCQYCAYQYLVHGPVQREEKELLLLATDALVIAYPQPGLQSAMSSVQPFACNDESDTLKEREEEEEEVEEKEMIAPAETIVSFEPRKEIFEKEEEVLEREPSPSNPTFEDVKNDLNAGVFKDIRKAFSLRGGGGTLDPRLLTGVEGLKTIVSMSEVGTFSYRPGAPRVFQRDTLRKYSSKISNVLDMIVDPKSNEMAKGLILVYSRNVEGVLIPMALALEEMGISRYGGKSFLSHTLSENSIEGSNRGTYSFITGDHKRFSPDNNVEIKAATDEENKNGDIIKVILISSEGTEGIDFKFIRQVHILDPWYNMSRIEQIIGRAVRHGSHKALPFVERNVQIFLYGTILGEENKEEAIDLYMYRSAERKAIQIGKVTRVLKETSVDCIIHHDQTRYTQENMQNLLKKPIRQVLSTGEILSDFKVGDAPFSPSCDYMAQCDYDCSPSASSSLEVNEDTYYTEEHLVTNMDKIIQRVKALMKESYFYKRDMLIDAIRTPREFPYLQIYGALTHLVSDDAEIVLDKYGRKGHLRNIGEYYLFQPLELKEKNASVFARSIPVDSNTDLVKISVDKRFLRELPSSKKEKNSSLLKRLKADYDEALAAMAQPDVSIASIKKAGNNDWYKVCGLVLSRWISKREWNTTVQIWESLLAEHIAESLPFSKKKELLNTLFDTERVVTEGSLEDHLKAYFDEQIHDVDGQWVFVSYDKTSSRGYEKKQLLLTETGKWKEGQIVMAEPIRPSLAPLFGYMGYQNKGDKIVFKTNAVGNVKVYHELREKLGYEIQNPAAYSHLSLCIMEEMLLRLYNFQNEKHLRWFLTPEEAIWVLSEI